MEMYALACNFQSGIQRKEYWTQPQNNQRDRTLGLMYSPVDNGGNFQRSSK